MDDIISELQDSEPEIFNKLLPYDAAHLILWEYFKYYHLFKRITKRAKIRFENKDWKGIQKDAGERNIMYRNLVDEGAKKLKNLLGNNIADREMWKEIKKYYHYDIVNYNTRNIAETYYNSVYRHIHKTLGADRKTMFVHATSHYKEFRSAIPIFRAYVLSTNIAEVIEDVLLQIPIDVAFEHIDRDVQFISSTLIKYLDDVPADELKLEILNGPFFRNKACYIVGRIYFDEQYSPFIIPILHNNNGIYADALLLDERDVSPIFSYNRSYFLVDVDIVKETVDFLKSFLPSKSMGELYNSIGFEKHGKTVFFRNFLRHHRQNKEKFIIAPGVPGMVMFVFTLPSYNMVFKVIRDKFQPPKNVTEAQVKSKYALVNRHDRVGRMTDSHMFENLSFDVDDFSEECLKELTETAAKKVEINGNKLILKHLYVEKKMIPLDIYLSGANAKEAEDVIDEYGKAIKQLASVNIFPGDMLLKNFGVTRLNRVVFYDYDEIGFLTDFNFRRIPEPRNDEEEWSREPYFHVAPNDIFPEEFPKFLIGHKEIKEVFFKLHGDLYDVKFWRETQAKLRNGEILDVFPYREFQRFSMKYTD